MQSIKKMWAGFDKRINSFSRPNPLWTDMGNDLASRLTIADVNRFLAKIRDRVERPGTTLDSSGGICLTWRKDVFSVHVTFYGKQELSYIVMDGESLVIAGESYTGEDADVEQEILHHFAVIAQ